MGLKNEMRAARYVSKYAGPINNKHTLLCVMNLAIQQRDLWFVSYHLVGLRDFPMCLQILEKY